ncbi:MAG: antiviral reverse transcriptase Drt3a [Parvibaculum sp.]|uniref:antiviral reverse transcriptase Drt3a n=1 Tax=Parvibaculum sp. TaxID=2024848 RepID=UPI0032EBBBF2
MYDFAFDIKGLSREFKRSDFGGRPELVDETKKDALLREAVNQAEVGFPSLHLKQSTVRSKTLYQPEDISQKLVLRKLTRNIARLTKVKQSDRDTIIRSLKVIFSEGHAFRIYKLDIRQFYESVDLDAILNEFRRDKGFPPASLKVLNSLASNLRQLGVPGLPRGMAVSAILSEYAMRSFDRAVRSEKSVYYSARYVDDVIIVSTGSENKKKFMRKLREVLPTGVNFNNGKCKTTEFFVRPRKGTRKVEGEVNFLGYKFSIFEQERKDDRSILRRVDTDMSDKKVRRFKTRMCLSLLQYSNDGNFADLYDRLRLLSGNYNLYDYDKKIRRNVGIYWSYRHLDPGTSSVLKGLDDFLNKLVLAKNGAFSKGGVGTLSDRQKRQILSLSFERSYATKQFHHFSGSRLAELVRCWAYE